MRTAVMQPLFAYWRRVVFASRYRAEAANRDRLRPHQAMGNPRFAVVYVYPIVGDSEHDASARRFVSTYRACAPMHDHTLHIVFNGGEPSPENLAIFDGVEIQAHRHDDTGWDIGAFQVAAAEIDCEVLVCLGGATYFKRAGWLRRMAEAVRSRGEGLYGASASYERDAHIRTTGFWCDPILVRAYPRTVRSYQDRYDFEASSSSLTRLAEHVHLGCWLVTWDGEYAKPEWRRPPNIFRRGDQSNSLVFDRYFDLYDGANEGLKTVWAAMADGQKRSRKRACPRQ